MVVVSTRHRCFASRLSTQRQTLFSSTYSVHFSASAIIPASGFRCKRLRARSYAFPSNRDLLLHAPRSTLYAPLRFTTAPIMSAAPASATPAEAHAMMEASPPALYLDVRTPTEFATAHPPTAVNVPVTLDFEQPVATFVQDVEKVANKGDKVVVGCKSGKRSMMAVGILQGAGWDGLTNLEGGFTAWEADANLPVERA